MASDVDVKGVLETFRQNWLRQREATAAELGITLDELESREVAEEAARKAKAEREQRRKPIAYALAPYANRIPIEIVEAYLEDQVTETRALVAVRTYLREGTKAFLVLSGGTGTGKTCAALEGIVRARHRGFADYLPASDIARRYEPWSADKDRGVVPLDLDVHTLVIDDLGTERGDDPRFMEAIGQVIDGRIGPMLTDEGETVRRKTIITTNLTPNEMKERYGDRVSSRLAEHAQLVVVRGEDMRRRKAS